MPREVVCAFKHTRLKKYFGGLKLVYAPASCSSPDLAHGKLLVVTPRACGKAHDRNRIKRQLRSIFYEEKLYTTPLLWIIFVRKDAMKLDFAALKKFLTTTLNSHES